MRMVGLLVVVLSCAGCGLFADQVPYESFVFASQARVVAEGHALGLARGDDLVFEITEGLSHGRFTTRHGSHYTVYLSLAEQPEAWKRYTFCSADGTLDYDGWWGWGYLVLDAGLPSRAEMTITDITYAKIKASVTAAIYYSMERLSQSDAPPEEPRLFVIDRTIVFRRNDWSHLFVDEE